jgi:AcrR family transcriptional regulator
VSPVTEQARPTQERPLRADARRNRERVLAAGRTVLAHEGYDAQMTDVAKKAGVGVGTVYRHFPDKTALIEALVAERFTQFAECARDALAADDAWAGFRGWLLRCGEIQAEDKMVCDFLSEAVGGERVGAIAEEVGLTAVTEKVVEHAKRAGALRDRVRADDIPPMMCGAGAVARSRGDEWRRILEFSLEGMRDPSYEPA